MRVRFKQRVFRTPDGDDCWYAAMAHNLHSDYFKTVRDLMLAGF